MGFLARLVDWVDAKVDRPADRGVLDGHRNPGSEAMIEAETGDEASAAARRVRRGRDRRRRRWTNSG